MPRPKKKLLASNAVQQFIDAHQLDGAIAIVIRGDTIAWFRSSRVNTKAQACIRDLVQHIAPMLKDSIARASEALEKLSQMGFLSNEGKGVGYRAMPDMKVNILKG